jgi:hypothetical protein
MLKVNQYRQINSEEIEGVFDKMIHLVSIVNDLDPFDVQDWRGDKLINAYSEAQQKIKLSERHSNKITIEGYELRLIDFSRLTLMQFINNEELINSGFDSNIHKIAASLYLRVEGGGMTDEIIEPYRNVNIEYRSELIDELPINSIYGACKKYLTFRDNFFNSYDLFHDPLEGVDPSELSEDELEIYNEEVKKREKEGGNQWLTLLNALSNNDITKFDSILDANLFTAFNQLSYLRT